MATMTHAQWMLCDEPKCTTAHRAALILCDAVRAFSGDLGAHVIADDRVGWGYTRATIEVTHLKGGRGTATIIARPGETVLEDTDKIPAQVVAAIRAALPKTKGFDDR